MAQSGTQTAAKRRLQVPREKITWLDKNVLHSKLGKLVGLVASPTCTRQVSKEKEEQMAFEWPRYDEPIPIDETRSWTAKSESYDQRNDECYYIVSLHEAGQPVRRIMAKVDIGWAGDDWSTSEFSERVKGQIHWVAAAGRSNTEYRGPLGP